MGSRQTSHCPKYIPILKCVIRHAFPEPLCAVYSRGGLWHGHLPCFCGMLTVLEGKDNKFSHMISPLAHCNFQDIPNFYTIDFVYILPDN